MKVRVIDPWWGSIPIRKKTVNFGQGDSQAAHRANGIRKFFSKNVERVVDAKKYRTRNARELRDGSFCPRKSRRRRSRMLQRPRSRARRNPPAHRFSGTAARSTSGCCLRGLSELYRPPTALRLANGSRDDEQHRRGMRKDGECAATAWRRHGDGTACRNPDALQDEPRPCARTGVAHEQSCPPGRAFEDPARREDFLNHEEMETLVTSAQEVTGRPTDAMAMAVELVAYARLRIGEVVTLEVGNVDPKARRMRTRCSARVDINGSPIFDKPKHGETYTARATPR